MASRNLSDGSDKIIAVASTQSEAHHDTKPGQPHTGLKKSISNRQFVFMAMGGSIGAGLLIASSVALEHGGPGGLLFGFFIVGLSVALTMGSLGELAAAFPVAGSFYDYSVQFISPSWGFAMGWNYIINFVLIVPFEVTVMVLIAQYWNTNLNPAILIVVFLAGLASIAACGAKWYAEAEHAFGVLKVTMLIAFTIAAIVIASGGADSDPRHGTHLQNWQGMPFSGGAVGFLWVFVAAGLAYGGTEMLGLTVAECEQPQKVMPLAFKIVGVRIVICYLLPLFMAGLIIDADTFREFDSLPVISPFVLAIRKANITVLPDIFNAVILLGVFSMANAAVFASSRALRAICNQGMGPKVFAQTTENGLPRNSLLVVFAISLIAFINVAPAGNQIFDWLLALASSSNFFTWISINVAQIRLRWAIRKQKKNPNEILVWRSPLGVWGSAISILISLAGLVSLLVSAAVHPAELHYESAVLIGIRHGLGFIVVLLMWLSHVCIMWKKNPHLLLIPLDDINLSNGDAATGDAQSV
ncbi:amino acid permease/ SLC12A domain-containing protein [Xylariales sp. PMI_506]|nr:amino acid permease/ SLC12A domain-containing protein [Xylariales sp. PMI_506]